MVSTTSGDALVCRTKNSSGKLIIECINALLVEIFQCYGVLCCFFKEIPVGFLKIPSSPSFPLFLFHKIDFSENGTMVAGYVLEYFFAAVVVKVCRDQG